MSPQSIAEKDQLGSPIPSAKKAKMGSADSGGSSGMLFRGATNLPKAQDEAAAAAAEKAGEATFQFDPVTTEIQRWKFVSPDELQPFLTPDGLLNEHKMMWHLRQRFPLHFIVFKQIGSHLPHEGNVEQYFSRAGALSDPHMDPEFLGKLVMCGANKLRFKPSVAQIKAHYYKMFRGKGAADEDEDEAQ